jgi:hypothetical protein
MMFRASHIASLKKGFVCQIFDDYYTKLLWISICFGVDLLLGWTLVLGKENDCCYLTNCVFIGHTLIVID